MFILICSYNVSNFLELYVQIVALSQSTEKKNTVCTLRKFLKALAHEQKFTLTLKLIRFLFTSILVTSYNNITVMRDFPNTSSKTFWEKCYFVSLLMTKIAN